MVEITALTCGFRLGGPELGDFTFPVARSPFRPVYCPLQVRGLFLVFAKMSRGRESEPVTCGEKSGVHSHVDTDAFTRVSDHAHFVCVTYGSDIDFVAVEF